MTAHDALLLGCSLREQHPNEQLIEGFIASLERIDERLSAEIGYWRTLLEAIRSGLPVYPPLDEDS